MFDVFHPGMTGGIVEQPYPKLTILASRFPWFIKAFNVL
jgi:hypothetical protein